MLGREKTSQQDRASCSLRTNLTWEWTVRQLNTFEFLLVFSTPKSPLFGFFFFFCTVRWFQFIWPLSCSPRLEYTPSLYSSPQMMNEINSHKRSGPLWQAEPPAPGSSDPFWTADKSKRFRPLVPSAENLFKICSCLLQSVPQFFYWCFFFLGRGSTWGWVRLEACAGREWCRSPW